jgi:3-oxoacyl-[acyl-carrier protein] reductase
VVWDLDPGGGPAAALAEAVDVTDEAAVQRAADAAVERLGRIDVLVNNAGISRHRPFLEMTAAMFEEVMRVNVTGTFICCRAVAPVMVRQGRGKIVNIASLAARTGRPGVAVNYAASKAAVVGLTQTLARELGPSGVHVNAIAPGPILTDQTRQYAPDVFATWNAGRAVPRDGTPEDVADAAVFLASHRSGWITGVTLDVNGGILIR